MENKIYKRQYRELTARTKDRISHSTKGKPKSEIHKKHISQALKDYWRSVPNRPRNEDHSTMDEYLHGSENNCDVKPSK